MQRTVFFALQKIAAAAAEAKKQEVPESNKKHEGNLPPVERKRRVDILRQPAQSPVISGGRVTRGDVVQADLDRKRRAEERAREARKRLIRNSAGNPSSIWKEYLLGQ